MKNCKLATRGHPRLWWTISYLAQESNNIRSKSYSTVTFLTLHKKFCFIIWTQLIRVIHWKPAHFPSTCFIYIKVHIQRVWRKLLLKTSRTQRLNWDNLPSIQIYVTGLFWGREKEGRRTEDTHWLLVMDFTNKRVNSTTVSRLSTGEPTPRENIETRRQLSPIRKC